MTEQVACHHWQEDWKDQRKVKPPPLLQPSLTTQKQQETSTHHKKFFWRPILPQDKIICSPKEVSTWMLKSSKSIGSWLLAKVAVNMVLQSRWINRVRSNKND